MKKRDTEENMAKTKKLIIVESPTKVKSIKKFLGAGYEVTASNGHVRDLPKSQLGIDIENDFEPKYITIRGKGELLSKLRKQVAKADVIYLATDPDREGEAISWHLIYALKLNGETAGKKVYRITFNEITKNAVTEALKNPREIDMNLVDAQQARRELDRIVGYMISPLLWAKVKRGLSAGRVQSVALRMIADREAEIDSFIPEEYWTLDAAFSVKGVKRPVVAHYYGTIRDGKQIRAELKNGEEVKNLTDSLRKSEFMISSIQSSERVRKTPLPFTTSTLQQEASKVLNFSTSKTMRVAQQLYEGIEIKGQGTTGLITYLRTDSTRISEDAQKMAASYIGDQFGEQYLTAGDKKSTNARIQDAHEAIRPSDITRTPELLKESLTREQFRLYQLIWRRFTASRMADARYEMTRVRVTAEDRKKTEHLFTMTCSRLVFDGFLKVYDPDDDPEGDGVLAKGLTEESRPVLDSFDPKQHFTQPLPHFTEASLVKVLEEKGIGRPSTYAPTISTILARRYITKDGKNLYMTEIGEVVNEIMIHSFPSIVNPDFTAGLESLLDGVADGQVKWKTLIENFYPDLNEAVKAAEAELEKVKIVDEESDEICEKCGRRMVIKYGPHGKFLACPGFPECRNTKPYYEHIGVQCPRCGSEIALMKSKKGRKFYGCINPECDFVSWQKPSSQKCPQCGKMMVEKGKKLVCMDQECGYVTEIKEERED